MSHHDVKGKKLLILAGAAVHTKVVKAAREMGVYTIVTDYLQPEQSPAKQIADESLMYNIYDVDALVEYVRTHQVDGVLGFCIDPTQRPAQQIAEKAGLPAFGTREQVLALTDKTVFKKLCTETGVDIILSYDERDIAAGNIRYPVLVKPVDSRGSRGATECFNEEELLAAMPRARKESTNGGCIIEKYMTPDVNQDLTISYLVKNGEPVLVSLGDRHSGRREDNLDRQLVCTIQPSRFVKEYLAVADERIKGLIRHLGIKNGPVFFQGYWDGETVRLYDPGLRYPGNEYEQILAKATGVNLMKDVIPYCLGGEIEGFEEAQGCYDLNGKVCMQYMINVGPGTIGTYEGLDIIARHPNVVDVTQKHFIGDVIHSTGDVRHRAGEISVLCPRTYADMKEMIDFIQSHLVIKDTEGRNQIISPFDTAILDRWYHPKNPLL